MKHVMLLCVVLILLATLLTGCSSADAEASKKIVRISHGQPDGHPDDIAVKAFADYVNERLGDKFDVQVYANGLLGDSKNALELTQTGAIEYLVCSTSNLEAYSKDYGIFSVPYLFSNKDAYFDFMYSDVADILLDSTVESGFRAVTWFDAGTRSFYANDPIEKPEDMEGMKIRVQPSPLNVAMIQTLGAGAVPMGFGEVYTALAQGTIDAAENNEMALTSVKHGEVAKYYSYDMHQMQPDMFVVNLKFYESLSDEERQIFEEATQVAHEIELVEWVKQTNEAKEIATNDMGVTFVDADVAAFQELCAPIQQDYLDDNPDVKVYFDEITKLNEASLSSQD